MRLSPRHIFPFALLAASITWIFTIETLPPLEPLVEEVIEPLLPPQPVAPFIYEFPVTLSLCPKLDVANAPLADTALHIIGYTATLTINDVTLARAPVETACVSSGFGNRNNQAHTGIDLYSLEPVDIYAAADGTIRKVVGTNIERNACHGSDAPETAAIEVGFFFSGAELAALAR